jgi:LCP family protein required for cell wall assembly
MGRRPDDPGIQGEGQTLPDSPETRQLPPDAVDDGRNRRVYYAPEGVDARVRPGERPRPAQRPQPGPRYDQDSGAPPPPRRPAPSIGRPKPPRRRRRVGRLLLVLLLVLTVGLGALYVVFDSKLRRVDALGDYQGRPAGGRGQNWLIVGSDSREGLTEAERDKLGTGFAPGRRTDTIMIMHIPSVGGGSPTLVSLPRDSYVPIPGRDRNKLNAAFSFGGPKLLAQTVEQATGLRMDHYMEIGFGGFAGMVDAVGSVNICIDKPVRDRFSGLDIRKAGCQDLGSKQALAYVRSRHGFAAGDLDRVKHQRQFIAALIKKATSPGVLLNPFKTLSLANAGTGALTVDEGDHLYNLVRLAFAMRALNGGDAVTTTVPVRGTDNVGSAGSVVLWDRAKAVAFFEALRNDRSVKGLVDPEK